MPYKDPVKARESGRERCRRYYYRNREKILVAAKVYRDQEKPWRKQRTPKRREWEVAYRLQRRAKLEDLKRGPCVDCGQTFHPVCMDFDHVRGTKRSTIAILVTRSWGAVMKEVAKCDLVCANCHRIRTHVTKVSKYK